MEANHIRRQQADRDKEMGPGNLSQQEQTGAATSPDVDFTENRETQALLLASEERHRTILMTAMDGFWVVNREGRILEVNQAYCRMSGFSEEELLAMCIADLESKESDSEVRKHMEKLVARGQDRFESRHRRKDGSSFLVEVSVQCSPGDDGLLFVFLRDISEQKLAQQRLIESEERFKALYSASFGGIAIHDKGLILECNQGLAEITGYRLEELVGMDGLLLIAPSTRQLVMDNIVSGLEKPYEARGLRKNGEEYPLRLEAKNIPFKGKMVRAVEFRDLSQQKHDEAERQRLQELLLQAQKMESIGRLAGGVAHDFNNMLGVILGRTEIAQLDLDPTKPLYADLEEIRRAAERSVNLTRQLLAFARKQTIAPRVLDFNEAVAGMLKMVQRLIGEDIDLVWLPGTDLWPVKIDPSQIDQVLANLCVNARDAIDGVGKVTIETDNVLFDERYCASHPGCQPGEYVLLALSDNGCGMDKKTQTQLFEPFFTTKEPGKGTGLGLATVYGIVKQNNGFINIYSEPGHGTVFRIYLPRHRFRLRPAAEVRNSEPAARGNATILLVEDEPAIINMTTLMLERLGYNVLAATSPTEAISCARDHSGQIDLLLTDIVMPHMNGRQLSAQLLTDLPGLKVLFMSGYTAEVIAHKGVLDQGIHFIEKPFTMSQLAGKIKAVLQPEAAADPA